MSRARRVSKVLEKAQVRLASIRSINPQLDLGNGLTVASYDDSVTDLRTKLADYNQALAALDEKMNTLVATEKAVGDQTERMLAGVAARYGKDSSEYEQAGGKRKSERKFPSRKAKTPPAAS
ncbi:MAG TPA: hypothetical protein VKA60_14900 [Blastocatellia bacterium]|nr:hypothetical protein [Blastocatellia bacterium]